MGAQNSAWRKISESMAQVAESMLALIYPPQCAVCLKCEQAARCRFLCEACLARVQQAEIPPVRWWQTTKEIEPEWRVCTCDLAAWFYEDGMMALIPRMKYRNRPTLTKVFAGIAVARLQVSLQAILASVENDTPVLVPVPLHPRRQRERGFNQSLLIARVFGAAWHLETLPHALRRTRFTPSQAKLDAAARAQNVRTVFAPARAKKLEGRTVFLVDDVITTGATVSGCART